MSHTQGRLGNVNARIFDDNGKGIATVVSGNIADADRITACWNACDGYADPATMRANADWYVEHFYEHRALKAQVSQLNARIEAHAHAQAMFLAQRNELERAIREAIAMIEEGHDGEPQDVLAILNEAMRKRSAP